MPDSNVKEQLIYLAEMLRHTTRPNYKVTSTAITCVRGCVAEIANGARADARLLVACTNAFPAVLQLLQRYEERAKPDEEAIRADERVRCARKAGKALKEGELQSWKGHNPLTIEAEFTASFVGLFRKEE